jgi:hypothetical protein
MAPKKKPGKKEDGVSDKDALLKAEAELLSLRRLLELKTFEVLLCCCSSRFHREQLNGA